MFDHFKVLMTPVLTGHATQTQLNKCSIVSVSNSLRAAATYYGLKTSLLSWRHSALEVQEAPLLTWQERTSTTNNMKTKSVRTTFGNEESPTSFLK